MDRVKRISHLLQDNVAQYQSLVSRLQDPSFSLPILDARNPAAHDDLLSEAERLLHNVLAAMSTRVDQQRVFMAKYFADDITLTAAYTANISTTFQGDVQASFLKELRNHLVHQELPVARSRDTMSATSFEITFILPSAPLLTWKWSSSTTGWIASCGEDVPIVDVVAAYARKAAMCDQSLVELIAQKYATEIREFRHAQEQYMREYNRAFGF